WRDILDSVNYKLSNGQHPDLRKDVDIISYLYDTNDLANLKTNLTKDSSGRIGKDDEYWEDIELNISKYNNLYSSFRKLIYELVRQYALDNMGKKFLVC